MKIALIRTCDKDITDVREYMSVARKFNATFEKVKIGEFFETITYIELNTMKDLIKLTKQIGSKIILELNWTEVIKGDFVLAIFDTYME